MTNTITLAELRKTSLYRNVQIKLLRDFLKEDDMKLDISELVLIANNACKNIRNLTANAGNIDLDAVKTQNEILKYAYQTIDEWMTNAKKKP